MNELESRNQNMLATQSEVPMGFEDEDENDFIIPRIKVVNALSPERKEKIADEGDIINSLTKEKLNGKIFIPIYKFTTVIKWKDRSEGGGIGAIAKDGKMCIPTDGSAPYPVGKLAEFDNTKSGKDALPTHTKYMNFFGFFSGEPMPIILSFAKTNYNEGKRLYSLAKVQMQNMWHYGYRLESKEMSKNGNEWFNIAVVPNGQTTEEDRTFGKMLFETFRNKAQELNYDTNEDSTSETDNFSKSTKDAVENAEF